MADNNAGKRKRNIFNTSNKYQEQIILLTFFPTIIMFLSFVCIAFIGDPIIAKAVEKPSTLDVVKLFNQYSLCIVLLMGSFLFLSLVASFIISRNMVGAFGRIIFELDEIIAGRSKRIITTRPKDYLSKDILKRINYLVKHYVVSRHEKENP